MSEVRVPDVLKSIAQLKKERIEGMLRVAAISPGATREMTQALEKLLELKELLGDEKEPSTRKSESPPNSAGVSQSRLRQL